jgi:PIN domain nuclease of toxin-antitoxin system
VNALLDTHTFLWWNIDDPQLSARVRTFIANGENTIYLSAASAWEIAIKCAKGRLALPESPEHYIANRMAYSRFSPLPVSLSHAVQVYNLPAIHADPFDRLLVAQAQIEGIPLLSGDDEIHRYEVEIIW